MFTKILTLLMFLSAIHLTATQDSQAIIFSSATAADELWLHVLECGALGGRY
jgi:hypothetical protein